MKASPNISHVLTLIRENGQIPQNDLAKRLELEKSTVSRIVKKLMENRLLQTAGEMPASAKGGRKPMLLELNPDGAYAIGIDFDIEQTKIALIALSGQVRKQCKFPTPHDNCPDTILRFLKDRIASFLAGIDACRDRLAGIGIGSPGIIDYDEGMLISAVNLKNWDKVPVAAIVSDEFQLPAYIDNSVRMMALAEKWYGDGRDNRDFLCVGIRYGIGLGIIYNSQLVRGSHNQAGDIHVSMDPNGPKCYCGRNGCIEALAGIRAVIRDCLSDNLKNTADVCRALRRNNGKVVDAVVKSGRYIGQTVAHLTEIFDPEKVILSGPLIDVNDVLFGSICSSYNDYCLKDRQLVPGIIKTKLGENGIVVGAGVLALETVFQ